MGIDPITAGIGAVGAIAGGIFGSKGTETSSTSAPWAAQQPYLQAGMTDAAYQYGQQRGSPYYQGNTYAQMDNHTQNALNGIYGYQGQGAANSSAVTGAGASQLGAGVNNSQHAVGALTGFNPLDPTQANIHNAGMYANNPALNGAIDAASRDVTRNLSEVQLPGIARNAVGNGNLNSSRTGIAEGIAMRGAQDQIGDISSTMRNQAYQNGLGLSEQARATNQGDYLNAQNQAGALSNQMVNSGYNGIQTGQGLQYDNYDAASAAGGLQQQNQQGILNQGFQKWQGNDQRPWELLNKYQGAITGAGSYPSQTNSSGGGLQGAFQGALGVGASALGLYGSYKNLNVAPSSPYMNTGYGGAH